jgi:putative exporter of polyketide antibiotics
MRIAQFLGKVAGALVLYAFGAAVFTCVGALILMTVLCAVQLGAQGLDMIHPHAPLVTAFGLWCAACGVLFGRHRTVQELAGGSRRR